MARTEGKWYKGIDYISPADDVPVLLRNTYLNFGGNTVGSSGYGFRDNAGVMQVKNSGGSWQNFTSGGAGTGDMLASTYDPNNVAGDAFDQDNMVDGTTNKNYTATEKTKLAGIETSADVTDTTNVTAAGALMDSEVTNLAEVKAFDSADYAPALGADDNYVTDAEKVVIGNTSGTNTGDQDLSGYELLSNKATDLTVLNNTLYPTTSAVQNAINSAVTGLLDYRTSYDASTNLFPATGGSGIAGAILKGDFWIVSVAGTLGGTAVTAGDLVIAIVDTPAQTAANWDIISNELGYAAEDVANKVTSLSGASTNTQYPSAKLTYDQLALKAPLVSPSFTTPSLGVASATTINKVTLTAPATGSTLAIADGKTFTVNQTLTLTGTTGTTMTFPSTSATIARTDAANTFTGIQTMTSPATTTSITTGSTSFTAWAGATTLLTIGGTGASASLFAPSTLDTTSSTTGAIRTSGGISAAKAGNIGTTLTVGSTIELGAATDTTLSRVAAGIMAIEGETLNGYTTTATAAGTTTLTITATKTQFFTGSSTQTVKLPTTSVIVGQSYTIVNNSTGLVTVQSSGANTIQILGAGMSATFTAIVATPTTAANWNCILVSSKGLNNAITASSNAATIDLAYVTNTVTNNSAATLTITIPTAGAIDGEMRVVRVYDASAVPQTLTLVNTQNSSVTPNANTNGSTTLPYEFGAQYNGATSKWLITASA